MARPDDGRPRIVVIGRVSRAHGVRGELSVDLRTDDPQRRFVPGAILGTDPASAGPLRILAARPHGTRLLLTVEGVLDRDAAEALRGVLLQVDASGDEEPVDPDEFWDHQIVGLAVRTTRGEPVGRVSQVLHLPGQELLAVERPDGSEVLVPFVRAIVPTVDLDAGTVVLDPPGGLLDAD